MFSNSALQSKAELGYPEAQDNIYLAIDLIKSITYSCNMNPFIALADPTRLKMFELIAQGEKSVGEIVQQFTFKAPTISQHLRVLKQAKLVHVRAEGQKRLYTVDQTGLQEMQLWLTRMQREWNGHLDALEHVLQKKKHNRKEI